MKKYCLVAVGLAFTLQTFAGSPQWPSWRGSSQQGRAESGSYAASFGPEKNLAWKVELPGRGCSTPIVWKQKVYLTSPVDGNDSLVCYDWSGKQQWATAVGPERPGKHRNGSGSNPSPVTDGESIFVYFKSGNVAGLDMDGKVLWKHNLQQEYGKDSLYWDIGSSPVVVKDYAVFTVMHESGSFLIAYEKTSGKLAWKTDRNYETPTEGDHSYTTPIVYDWRGQEAIMVWGAEHLNAYGAANGKELWTCGGFNPEGNRNWVTVGSHVVAGDMAVIPFGRGSRLIGVKTDGEGKVEQAWRRTDTGAFCPTPAAKGDTVYLLGDKGEVSAIDAKSGKTKWSGKLPKNRNKFYSSPTFADDKLYMAREDGVLFVVKVDPDGMELLAENNLGERLIAAPVPVAGRLLLRGEKHLFCVEAPPS